MDEILKHMIQWPKNVLRARNWLLKPDIANRIKPYLPKALSPHPINTFVHDGGGSTSKKLQAKMSRAENSAVFALEMA